MDLISRTGQPEMMPVLRHGPVLAHILETAISSQGPADPRLFTLLENDDMAQVICLILKLVVIEISFCLFRLLIMCQRLCAMQFSIIRRQRLI